MWCHYNLSCSHPRKQQFCQFPTQVKLGFTKVGSIPTMQWSPEWHDNFRFGNPKLNLHWPVLLGGGLDPTYRFYSIRCNQRPQLLQPRYGTNELKSRWYNGTVLENAGRIAMMSTMQGATTIPTGNGMIEWREEKIRQGLKCDGKTSKKNIDGGIDIMKRFPQKRLLVVPFWP